VWRAPAQQPAVAFHGSNAALNFIKELRDWPRNQVVVGGLGKCVNVCGGGL